MAKYFSFAAAAMAAFIIGLNSACASPATRADMKGVAASNDVRVVLDWIMRHNKHRGLPFVVADKLNSALFAFDGNGVLLGKTLGLFGKARGDVLTDEQANKTIAETLPEDMITPAGIFRAHPYRSAHYGDSVRFAQFANSNLLIHRAPNVSRLKKLQAATRETRITLGCINALPEFIDKILVPNFSGESTVFVLPETHSARAFFGITDNTPEADRGTAAN